MKHYYLLFLFGLFFLAGCGKKDPEPPLTGHWDWVQSKATHFRPDGSFWYEELYTPATEGAHYLLVTADSMNQHHQTTGILRVAYSRSGNTLRVNPQAGYLPYTLTITELTDHRLVMRYEKLFGTTVDARTYLEYSRQ